MGAHTHRQTHQLFRQQEKTKTIYFLLKREWARGRGGEAERSVLKKKSFARSDCKPNEICSSSNDRSKSKSKERGPRRAEQKERIETETHTHTHARRRRCSRNVRAARRSSSSSSKRIFARTAAVGSAVSCRRVAVGSVASHVWLLKSS